MFLRKNDIDRTRILHRQLDGRTQTDKVIPVYPPPPRFVCDGYLKAET